MIRCWLIICMLSMATGKERSFEVIDTHTHLLLHGLMDYPWVKDNRPFLKENFTMDMLESAAMTTPVKHFIIMEAVFDAVTEVEHLIKISKTHDSIVGIVAGFPLNESLQAKLNRIKPGSILVGIRDRCHKASIIHTDPSLWPSLKTLERKGLTLDVMASATDLTSVCFIARKFPRLKIIIDHLARPFLDPKLDKEWMEGITEVANCSNVYVKISQFFNAYDFQVIKSQTLRANRSLSHYEEIKPKVEHVLKSFGADRCMFGSDWPNGLTGFGNYSDIYDLADKLLQDLSEEDRKKIFSENAIKVYGLTACLSEPCQNGGVCTSVHNGYTCRCPTGYAGAYCEDKSDAGRLEGGNLMCFVLIGLWMGYWIR